MKLVRKEFLETGIFGELFDDDGAHFCFTLERAYDSKPKLTDGIYKVVFEYSPRFNRKLWELKGVPDHAEIKFHSGNKHTDSDGCVLVGLKKIDSESILLESRAALEKLHKLLDGKSEFFLTVESEKNEIV